MFRDESLDFGQIFLRVGFITTATQSALYFLLGESNGGVVVHLICVSEFVSFLVVLPDLPFDVLLVSIDSIVLHLFVFMQLLFLELLVDQSLHLLSLQLLLLLSSLCLLGLLES